MSRELTDRMNLAQIMAVRRVMDSNDILNQGANKISTDVTADEYIEALGFTI